MALTPDQEKLKEAALAALPGKWSRQTGYFVVAETDYGSLVVAQTNNSSWPGRNADFIAAANPAAILAILAQLEQVQGFRQLFIEWWQTEMDDSEYFNRAVAVLGITTAELLATSPLPPPPEAA